MAKATTPTPAGRTITWPFVHTLTKPIDDPATAGHKLTQIKLREPTTGDMLKHGFLDGEISAQSMLACIADLSGLAPPTLEFLHPKDFFTARKVLADFFGQAVS